VAALTLAGCGRHPPLALLGVHPGMTQDEVKAVAPAGSALYCRGGGDPDFEKATGLPETGPLEFCTWANVDSSGNRSRAQVEIGKTTSSQQLFAFDPSAGTLKSFSVEIAGNAYDAIVQSISEDWGTAKSPAIVSMPGLAEITDGVYWDGKDERLKVEPELTRSYMTVVTLYATTTPSN